MKLAWKSFLDTDEELHAFVIGLFEILCPWPPQFNPSSLTGKGKGESDNPTEATSKEYHYYLFGRGMGVIAWIIIAKLIQVAFW
jgi:hypothetical protein